MLKVAQLLQTHQQYECLEQQKLCVNVYGLWMVKLERRKELLY